ncbi:glycoside hydrolase family 15 protein [Actinomadura sp. NEAU-AAG7]|uniref:glycoside hydrolase family 15 protein n=1 Tax=Actinomadura sp. NEAU-AAG7 TaxID=2839640 RepID=UPI001BE413C4|nr:glycoside hydrolase family 15 protein [Actinomadura sp. NEAU-AAG7]MBT2209312.1 glycoside hydrolase family 15 protein [Actinomadura sp. NEAU-AAG7]
MNDDRYPPQVLREYALIADGERGVVVGPRGEFCWMCAPRWDGDAVFASLIGGPGIYAVTPRERFVWGGAYEPGTLIWRSRWVTDDGVIECREALAFPGEPGRAVLLRQIVAREGDARVRVLCDPRPGFGAFRPDFHGAWTGDAGGLWFRWTGAAGARRGRGLELDLTVPAGTRHDLVLEITDRPPRKEPPVADRVWHATETAWHRAVPRPRTIADRDARHAHAVMRGMTGASGGMVAAATTSLPERSEAGRNYDYRYVWIRDQCFAGLAAAAAGAERLFDDAVRFVTARVLEDGPRLKPAYTSTGGPVPEQDVLKLPGYPGGYDRVGNQMTGRFQLDGFGDALLLLGAAAERDGLDADGRRALRTAVAAVDERWRDPDAGIWELDDRRWTHSALNCAAGLRAVGETGRADAIVAATASRAVHPSGRWQRSPGDPRLDGALLLPAIRGAVPAGDPRSRRTLDAYLAELTDDGYAYRFRHDERPLGEAEGAFLPCGFLVALATHRRGDVAAALRWFERNRSACGPAGLLSEEYDVEQRQMRGNLPQAFVHALLLECAARLDH